MLPDRHVRLAAARAARSGSSGEGEVLVARADGVAGGAGAATAGCTPATWARFDERGRLVITGRKADTIVTGGENVAPVEVEDVLLTHPAVADAAVYGRADPEWGEAVVGLVVLADGLSVVRG